MWLDGIKALQAADDLKNLKEAQKAVGESKTRERSPEAMEAFLKSTTEDRDIGISADAVRELYGDKPPADGDGLLGFIPNLENQLRLAEASGQDVKVPLSSWLANVDPAVAKQLEEHLRLRPEGMTTFEADALKEREAQPLAQVSDDLGLARREAGLEPLAQVGRRDVRLQKASSEVDSFGQTFDTFHIIDEGKPIGHVVVNQTPKGVLYIEDWAVNAGANAIGPHAVRAMIEGLKAEYPDATHMGGYRVSGGRTGTKNEANWVQVPLSATAKGVREVVQALDDIKGIINEIDNFRDNLKGWREVDTSVPREPAPEGTIREKVGRADVEYRPNELYTARETELIEALGKVFAQIAPDLNWAAFDRIEVKGAGSAQKNPVHGLYKGVTSREMEPYVLVALHGPETMGTALHEVIHHLRSGYFTAKEWGALEAAAKDGKWIDKHSIDSRYPKAPEWLKYEEAIAEEYRTWAKSEKLINLETPSAVVAVFKRIKELFDSILDRLHEVFGKDLTSDELFTRVTAGEVGSRKPSGVGASRFTTLTEALAQATEAEEVKLFERGAAIGMTQDQFKRYLKLMDSQREETEARAQRRAERAVEHTKTEQWKEAEPKVREEVTEAVNNRPDILADEFFRQGKLGDQKVKRLKIAEKFVPEELRKVLGDQVVAKEGINPNQVAGLFGYVSGDQMLQSLAALKAARDEAKVTPQAYKNQLIRAQFDSTMQRRYGVPEHDAMLKEAREDIISETVMDMLAEETLALATKAGQAPPMSKANMKAWVKDAFREEPATRAKDMVGYLQAAGRAGRAAEDALLKGDAVEAFRQKQRQFIAMISADEAKKFAKEADKFDRLTKRLTARQVASISQEYTDQAHGIMRRLDLPVKRSVQDLEAALGSTTLEKFVATKEADLRELPVADFLYDPAWSKPMAQLTVQELRDIDRSLRTLAHNGAEELKVEKAGEKADLQAVRDRMVEQLETFPAAKMVPLEQGRGKVLGLPSGGLKQGIRTFVAAHLQMENLLNRWDRFDPKGLFNQYIMRPLAESSNTLASMERKYSNMLRDLKDESDLKELVNNTVIRDPLTGDLLPMSRRNFRALLANVGSNLDQLARGYKVDPAELMAWVNRTAKKEDWDFVQKQGKVFEEIFKEAARMYERLAGIAPEKIEPKPVQTAFGEIEGWYHPLIYDRLREGPSKKLMGKDGLEEPEYFRATTAAGYTKKRTGYAAPISLNPDLTVTRIKQMLNDIAMREAVINAGKFFYDKDVRAAIAKHSALGPEVRDGLIPYLKDVANIANIDSAAASVGAQWSEWLRQNIIATLIGLNPGTVLKHGSTAAIQSLQEVGAGNFLREVKTLFNRLPSGESNWAFALKTSEELQRRHRHYAETLGGGYQEAFQEPSLRAFVQHAGSYPVAMSDLFSAVPTWLAAYRTEMEAGGTKGDAMHAGDRAVRRAHGSTAQTNRPTIMRGGAVNQWFTSLFGFFSHIMNRQVELVWKASDTMGMLREGDIKGGSKEVVKTLLPGLMAYILWPALVEELVTPLTNEDHESWGVWGAKALVKNVSASWIGVRDVTSAILTGHDPSSGLIGALFKAGTDVARDAISVATKGKDKSDKLIKHGAVMLGALTGLSNAQVGKTGEFIYNYMRGRERPKKIGNPLGTTPGSFLRGLRYGESTPPRR
jgi:hypothetical protein